MFAKLDRYTQLSVEDVSGILKTIYPEANCDIPIVAKTLSDFLLTLVNNQELILSIIKRTRLLKDEFCKTLKSLLMIKLFQDLDTAMLSTKFYRANS